MRYGSGSLGMVETAEVPPPLYAMSGEGPIREGALRPATHLERRQHSGKPVPPETPEAPAPRQPSPSVVRDLDTGLQLTLAEVERTYEARDLDTGQTHSLLAIEGSAGLALDEAGPFASPGSEDMHDRVGHGESAALSDEDTLMPEAGDASAGGDAVELVSGFLLKRGKKTNVWKQRWCRVTRSGHLETFNAAPGAPKKRGKFDLDLRLCSLRLALPDDETKADWNIIAAAVAATTSAAPSAFETARASGRSAQTLSRRLSLQPTSPGTAVTSSQRAESPRGMSSRKAAKKGDLAQLFGFVLTWEVKAQRMQLPVRKSAGGPGLPVFEERLFYCTSSQELDEWLRGLSMFASCQMSLRVPRTPGRSERASATQGLLQGDPAEEGMADRHGFYLSADLAAKYHVWLERSGVLAARGQDPMTAEHCWSAWLRQQSDAGSRKATMSTPRIPEGLVWKGVPAMLRGRTWLRCSGAHRYRVLLPGYYEALVAKATASVPPSVASEVERDLHRTFPNHPHFAASSREALGITALRRVLLAFATHNPTVGYAQALNYVAAMLLVATSFDQEASFWLLACLAENVLPDFYSPTLAGLHDTQERFNRFLPVVLPQLAAHVDRLGMPMSFVTTPWFMTLFANVLPSETVLRIWDVLFVDGPVILELVGAALMKYGAPQLMAAESMPEVAEILSALGREEWDADALLAAAAFRGLSRQQRQCINRMRHHSAQRMQHGRRRVMASVRGLI